MNRHFSKDDIRMASNNEKILDIFSYQGNAKQITMRYHFATTRIKKSDNNKC